MTNSPQTFTLLGSLMPDSIQQRVVTAQSSASSCSMATPSNENSGTQSTHGGADPNGSSQQRTANSEEFVQQDASQQPVSQPSQQEATVKGKRKPTRPPSQAWDHFTKSSDGYRATCNYCSKQYACDSKKNGTSNLLSHLTHLCPNYPNREQKKQKTLSFQPKKSGEGGSNTLVDTSFSVDACRDVVAKMIIIDELPFKFVENEGFRLLCSVLEPRFSVPSRKTVARDCLQIFVKERRKLRDVFKKTEQRVSLTTDTWTSVQNLNYMCLTAHYIDSNWNYKKKILNFCLVPNHKGETIGKQLETCLLEWGIERVFTVTVDNASSNDVAISYLSKKVNNWGGAILGGEFMHMRCCAHILNLIVTEGLKEYHVSINRIRNVVRYVRASPARLDKFKTCVEQEKISCTKLVCLDVTTRWNSTYLMLEPAEKFQKAFERLEDEDSQYLREFCLSSERGAPDYEDWENARAFIKFLKTFYDATLKFSGSLYATSNSFLRQLSLIRTQIRTWANSRDPFLKKMGDNMGRKYDKYWGSLSTINPMLSVSVLLDPRYKEQFLGYCLSALFGEDIVNELISKVRKNLNELYDHYVRLYSTPSAQNHNAPQQEIENEEADRADIDVDALFTSGFMRLVKETNDKECKTEVDRYLMESCEDLTDPNFDILAWWKVNSSKYKTLSLIARDVLAIPVSTVASESAFSTGGRILDPFRSSLSPKTVEALICAQNWIRSSPKIDLRESMDEIESDVLGSPISTVTQVD